MLEGTIMMFPRREIGSWHGKLSIEVHPWSFAAKPLCEYVCVCERERERKREGAGSSPMVCFCIWISVCVCVFIFVCVHSSVCVRAFACVFCMSGFCTLFVVFHDTRLLCHAVFVQFEQPRILSTPPPPTPGMNHASHNYPSQAYKWCASVKVAIAKHNPGSFLSARSFEYNKQELL